MAKRGTRGDSNEEIARGSNLAIVVCGADKSGNSACVNELAQGLDSSQIGVKSCPMQRGPTLVILARSTGNFV